jgi:1-acyl-sn-glycerol-3-phosphate acyltransferase
MASRAARTHLRHAFYAVSRYVSAAALATLTGVRHFDVPDLSACGGVLIASNHQSYLDPVLVAVALERPTDFLAREDLFRVPGFGALITALGAHPIRRGHADTAALRTVIETLRDGRQVLVFPEGTRTADGKLGEFRRGIGSIAIRCGVPVLPVCIEGAYAAWPRWRALPMPRRVVVAYGRLVSPQGVGEEELVERVRSQIEAMQARLRQYLAAC